MLAKPKRRRQSFPPPQPQQEIDAFYFDPDEVVSATECTGLTPVPPASRAEAEAYAELYPIPEPDPGRKSRKPSKPDV